MVRKKEKVNSVDDDDRGISVNSKEEYVFNLANMPLVQQKKETGESKIKVVTSNSAMASQNKMVRSSNL